MSSKLHNFQREEIKSSEDWYIEAFSQWYKVVYSHRNEKEAQKQVEFLSSVIPISQSSKILDLCCGYGRHIKFLSKLSNFVVGIDLSPALLKEAKNNNETGTLICGDVRTLPFKEQYFDIILSLFTSFGYFHSDEENLQHLKNSANVLKDSGYFVLDYLNPQKTKTIKKRSSTKIIGKVIIQETKWFEKTLSRINKKVTIKNNSGKIIKSYIETVKVYDFQQLREMFTECRISIANVYGDYSTSSQFTDKSPRLIIIGKKV